MTQEEIRAEYERIENERSAAMKCIKEINRKWIELMHDCEHPRREEDYCPDCGADWSPDH